MKTNEQIKEERIEEYLRSIGATNLKWYSLINNYGITYDIGEKHFDTEHIVNCYGAVCNWWTTISKEATKEECDIINNKVKEIWNSEV